MKLKIMTFAIVLLGMIICQTAKSQEIVDSILTVDAADDSIVFETLSYPEKGTVAFRGDLAKYYNLPRAAIDRKLSGQLAASFVIDIDGKLKDVVIIKDLGYGTGKELKKALQFLSKRHQWTKAIVNGKLVNVRHTITFSISSGPF